MAEGPIFSVLKEEIQVKIRKKKKYEEMIFFMEFCRPSRNNNSEICVWKKYL